jgi:hypothetical protein
MGWSVSLISLLGFPWWQCSWVLEENINAKLVVDEYLAKVKNEEPLFPATVNQDKVYLGAAVSCVSEIAFRMIRQG